MPEFVPMEKLKQMIGQENGLSDWVLIDQDRINRFADVTGQRSWIHVDIERAKEGPYGGPIGHGDLTPLPDPAVQHLSEGGWRCIMTDGEGQSIKLALKGPM